jgi:hypothetical protein
MDDIHLTCSTKLREAIAIVVTRLSTSKNVTLSSQDRNDQLLHWKSCLERIRDADVHKLKLNDDKKTRVLEVDDVSVSGQSISVSDIQKLSNLYTKLLLDSGEPAGMSKV